MGAGGNGGRVKQHGVGQSLGGCGRGLCGVGLWELCGAGQWCGVDLCGVGQAVRGGAGVSVVRLGAGQ